MKSAIKNQPFTHRERQGRRNQKANVIRADAPGVDGRPVGKASRASVPQVVNRRTQKSKSRKRKKPTKAQRIAKLEKKQAKHFDEQRQKVIDELKAKC